MLWGVHGSYEEVLFKDRRSDHSVCHPRHYSAVLDASAHFRSHDEFAITGGLSYIFLGSCPEPGKYRQPLFSMYALPLGVQKTGGAADDSWRLVGVLGLQVDYLLRKEDGIRVQVDAIRNWGGGPRRSLPVFRRPAASLLRQEIAGMTTSTEPRRSG